MIFATSALTLYYPISDVLAIIGIVSILAGAMAVFFSQRNKDNAQASAELINKLTQLRETDTEDFKRTIASTNLKVKELEGSIKDYEIRLAEVSGQLNTYKTLPLKEWAESMKSIAITNQQTQNALDSIDKSNQLILETLKKSALLHAQEKKNEK